MCINFLGKDLPLMNPTQPLVEMLGAWSDVCMRLNMHDMLRFAKANDLTLMQTDVLELLYAEDGCDITTICNHLMISRSAASQLVDRLLRDGMVTRSDNPADRRSKIVRLSDDGLRLIKARRVQRQAWLAALAAQLPPESDPAQIADALNALIAAAQALDIDDLPD
jgi:DNA-binding MarR family transcriptional regulator